jgi:predicted RNase H-like nuclease (RuvC/YqgF family)
VLVVGRLTERCKQLEAHNEQLQGDFRRLDQESADVIAFLRRQLTDKGSEIGELQERLTGLKQVLDNFFSFVQSLKNICTISLSGERG